jgi:hypothetical protein
MGARDQASNPLDIISQILPEAFLDGREHVPSDRQVALGGREAQRGADLRWKSMLIRVRFAPDSMVAPCSLPRACGRVARTFCGVNDAIAPAAPQGITGRRGPAATGNRESRSVFSAAQLNVPAAVDGHRPPRHARRLVERLPNSRRRPRQSGFGPTTSQRWRSRSLLRSSSLIGPGQFKSSST